MDKNKIKKFALWARKELLQNVRQRAAYYGITDSQILDSNEKTIHGRILSSSEIKQCHFLIDRIKKYGYDAVIEETAYIYFHHFIVLRYLEVNEYLPNRLRLFTDEYDSFHAEILKETIQYNKDILDMDIINALDHSGDVEALYKYLLITQCNRLKAIFPYMFEKIEDDRELLFPDHLFKEGNFIDRMIQSIDKEDWIDNVEIIGWLYQYYNSEKKDKVFAYLKKNEKIKKEDIPAATQLFTPDWIVKYMVENSLGKLWTEGHPDVELQSKWQYFLEDPKQDKEVDARLYSIKEEHGKLRPEDIRIIDPCMGSGHLLVYAFEILMEIYEREGYSQRDAAELILKKNIYGLDLDEKVSQLACFSLMMVARKYNSDILSKGIRPNLMAIEDSSVITDHMISLIANGNKEISEDMYRIKNIFVDAKEYGSLLFVPQMDFQRIYDAIHNLDNRQLSDMLEKEKEDIFQKIRSVIKQSEILAQKYHVSMTNPPYMSNRNMNGKLTSYLQEHFPDNKLEMFTTFIEKCMQLTKPHGYVSMITIHSWMFLSSFEKTRKMIYEKGCISSMLHTGAATFSDLNSFNVLASSFTIRNTSIPQYKGLYVRLADYYDENTKIMNYHKKDNYYQVCQEAFLMIPSSPIIYWIPESTRMAFLKYSKIGDFYAYGQGMSTGDNKKYLRLWHEVAYEDIAFHCHNSDEAKNSGKKWFPYNKGGNFRKWYGNNEYVVEWEKDGEKIKEAAKKAYGSVSRSIKNRKYYFQKGITWSLFGFENFSVRYKDNGFLFDVSGSSMFPDESDLYYVIGYLCSNVAFYFLSLLAPTVNFQVGNIANLPYKICRNPEIDALVKENIAICKEDWDSSENSWDFQGNPLIKEEASSLQMAYSSYKKRYEKRREQLRSKEERLNVIFREIYQIDEVDISVKDRDLSIPPWNGRRVIKSFLSYALACILGRYGDGDFKANDDNILPIGHEECFANDILQRFEEFLKYLYGQKTLEDNLFFIADVLGGKGTCREIIRNYYMKDFFSDHCKAYQKRPIYWLFDSGKKNAFKCLIYIHRYDSQILERIRSEYIHKIQRFYKTEMEELSLRMLHVTQREKVKLNKKWQALEEKSLEIDRYEEKINHLADQMIPLNLDDGIIANYTVFQEVLARIK